MGRLGEVDQRAKGKGPQSTNHGTGAETPIPKSKSSQIGPLKNGAKLKRRSSDPKYVTSRMEISAVTINMSGRGVLGVTPKYKIDMVETFLKTVPDVVFLQDSIDKPDIKAVLKKVSDDNYDSFFQKPVASTEIVTKGGKGNRGGNTEDMESRSLTGIAWHRDKFVGTPLELDDDRLKDHAEWLKKHDVTIVKIDSAERHEAEDVYPSCVAVSWHGPDYDKPLRQRSQDCDQLFAFLTLMRKNNMNIPIIIGGDFNMDMKSYDLKRYPDFLLVPYRPVSGNLAKDLKNSFVFTFDCLQVTETAFKQHHPDIFAAPFITIKVRGRNMIRIWAVIRIQRAARRMLRRIHEKRAGMKKLEDSKKRWRRKIEGEDYVSSEEEEEPPTPPRALSPFVQPLDPHSAKALKEQQDKAAEEEYEYRRRKSFSQEGSKHILDDFYNKPLEIPVSNHRRKKYSDLKSVQDRKKETDMNSYLYRSGI